ncbi:MAG TPA: FliH/SctL family protein [Verrucomicrobiae bacterium]
MKSWSEKIMVSSPLRDVQLAPPPGSPQWEERVKERERAAYERGVAAGERSIGQMLIQQRADMLDLQTGIFTALRQTIPQLVAESETALLELVTASVQKIIASIPIDAGMIEAVVREALEQMEHASEVTVHLHPHDLDLLRKINAPLLLEQVGGKPLHFQQDVTISRGGCLLKTSFGIVDARRETKVERLANSLAA